MAAGGTEVARAYVTIIPKTDGTSGKVVRKVVDPLARGGGDAGTAAGRAFSDSFGRHVRGAAKTLGKGLALGFGAATAAAGLFAKSAIDAGRGFDESMSQVAATMGKSVDEVQDLRDFAKEMGKSTKFTASEAADALNYMALAGYDATTSMDMLPTVLNLAAAGSIDLASASDMVTDVQSALGLSLDETTQLVDKMAAAASKSNTSVAQLGSAMLTVGGTARTMSGGTTEAAQALGLLADNGIKGSEGGTALRNILLSLSNKKFAETFGEMGVSAYDAEGNMRSLKDVFLDMNDAMDGMTDEQRTEMLSAAFNKVDLKSVNALLGTSAERWDELAAAIDDSAGAAERMADTQLDNLAGDLTVFASAWEGVKIAFSDELAPSLRDFVQVATAGLGSLTAAMGSSGFKSFMSTVADGFKAAAAFATGFVEALTPVVTALDVAGDSGGSAAQAVQDMGGMFQMAAGTAEDLEGAASTLGEMFGGGDFAAARDFGAGVAEGLKQATAAVQEFVGAFAGTIDVEGFKQTFLDAASAIGMAFGEGGEAGSAADFGTAMANAINGLVPILQLFVPILGAAASAIVFFGNNADWVVPIAVGLGAAFAAIKAAVAISTGITAVSTALGLIGGTGAAAGAGLGATAAGETAAGTAAAAAGPSLLEVGGAVALIGVGVLLAAAGMWVLAQAAATLAEGGPVACEAMGMLVVAILALGAGAATAGAAMTAGAVGILAFGAAVLMVGVGVLLACAGIALLATQLPSIATYGQAAGMACMVLGPGLMLVGAGAVVAGVGAVVLGVGLIMAAAGLTLAAGAMTLAAGGAALLGEGLGVIAGAVQRVGQGALDMGAGLDLAGNAMPLIAQNAAGAGLGVGELATAMALASGKLGEGSEAMAAAGDGATALASGVTTAAREAERAASGFSKMASAAMQGSNAARAGVSSIPCAVSAAGSAMTSFASKTQSAMRSASSSASSAASSIRRSINGIQGKTVRVNVAAGSVRLPHFWMSGSFDPKTKAVPTVGVNWYAKGAIFEPGKPGLIGIGDAKVPEVAAPLDKLGSLLGLDGGGRREAPVFNITVNAGGDGADVARELRRELTAWTMTQGRKLAYG